MSGNKAATTKVFLNPRYIRLLLAACAACLLLAATWRYSDELTARLPQRQVVTNYDDVFLSIANTVNWTRFAYVQYVTDEQYFCNAVMIFETLHSLGCRADRLLLYPKEYSAGILGEDDVATSGRLLQMARDRYNVKLQPITIQHKDGLDSTWADSFTKLLAMNQTQYDRTLSLDADGIVLQCLDHLFLLPPAPAAMPRAYWQWKKKPGSHEYDREPEFSNQLMLLQPSKAEFGRVQEAIKHVRKGEYDMDVMNELYGGSAMVLSHREYDVLTGEFRHKPDDHEQFLGSKQEMWNATDVLRKAKYLHFSDWPVPKPWFRPPPDDPDVAERKSPKTQPERDMWFGFYKTFKSKRLAVCGLGLS